MIKLYARLLAATLFIVLSSCSAKKPGLAAYWLDWSDQALVEWQVKSAVLSSQSKSYCEGNAELHALRSLWVDLSLHWAALNGFPFKAISDKNLEFDLYFWPDKRNMIEQAMSKRVASSAGLNDVNLSEVVAAEKGIPAMEWLIFNESISPEQRCASLPTIAGYYSEQVGSVVNHHNRYPVIQQEWIERRASIESDSIGLNLTFQQVGHVSNRLNNGFDTNGQIIPILSEGWRSQETTRIVLESLTSLKSHLEAARTRLDIRTESKDKLQEYEDQLEVLSQRLADEIDVNNPTELSNPSTVLEIRALLLHIEVLIEGPLATETGVLIGFNNYDGD